MDNNYVEDMYALVWRYLLFLFMALPTEISKSMYVAMQLLCMSANVFYLNDDYSGV